MHCSMQQPAMCGTSPLQVPLQKLGTGSPLTRHRTLMASTMASATWMPRAGPSSWLRPGRPNAQIARKPFSSQRNCRNSSWAHRARLGPSGPVPDLQARCQCCAGLILRERSLAAPCVSHLSLGPLNLDPPSHLQEAAVVLPHALLHHLHAGLHRSQPAARRARPRARRRLQQVREAEEQDGAHAATRRQQRANTLRKTHLKGTELLESSTPRRAARRLAQSCPSCALPWHPYRSSFT